MEEVVVARQKKKEKLADMIYSGGDSVNSVNLDMKDLLKRWNRSSIFRRKTHTLKENDQENQTEDSPTA